MALVNPASKRNKTVSAGMAESGDTQGTPEGFKSEAHARNALRSASMYGDRDGSTAKATKQFPHLAKEHSGVHREAQGKDAKTIVEHRREAQGKKLSGRSGPVPAQNNETMATSAPPESTGQMDGQDVSEDGDESFMNA